MVTPTGKHTVNVIDIQKESLACSILRSKATSKFKVSSLFFCEKSNQMFVGNRNGEVEVYRASADSNENFDILMIRVSNVTLISMRMTSLRRQSMPLSIRREGIQQTPTSMSQTESQQHHSPHLPDL
jgi:hypothetical protein